MPDALGSSSENWHNVNAGGLDENGDCANHVLKLKADRRFQSAAVQAEHWFFFYYF